MKRSVLFVCFGWIALNGKAADVTSYFVSKGMIYSQTNAGLPQPKRSAFAFHARATASNSTSVIEARVRRGVWEHSLYPAHGGRFYSTANLFSQPSGFDPFFSDGNYTVVLQTRRDGLQSISLPLFVPGYPRAPHVANYDAAQQIAPSADFNLTWDFWTNGSPFDLISLLILDGQGHGDGVRFQTSTALGSPDAIQAENTSVTIPAGTLSTGRVYLARLRFDKIIATNLTTYPGVPGFSSAFAATDFYVKTTGATDATTPRIVYVNPANGVTNVPVSTALSWAFNKPMRTNSTSFSFSGAPLMRFTSSAEDFVLTLTPTDGWFSSNSVISWGLNRWDDTVFITDREGNPLFTDLWSDFTTGASTNRPPAATAPRLDGAAWDANGVDFLLHGTPGRSYMIQSSPAFSNWSMTSLIIATNSSTRVRETNAAGVRNFYRAVALP